jgi:1,4-alpha-glucan branching enzyme
MIGAFSLVLCAHIPYVRMRYYRGEAWLHEALLFSYLPVLEMLTRLQQDGIDARLTLSFSPVLLEQLAEPDMRPRFDAFVDERIRAAEDDIAHYSSAEAFNEHLRYLAALQRDSFQTARDFWHRQGEGGLIGALRALHSAGRIEIAASAATHAYLPLLPESALRPQIATGIAAYQRHFGVMPTSFMLPEHAYRPGIERLLSEYGVRLFFVEGHAVRGGDPSGAATGEVFGGYGAVKRQYAITDRFSADFRAFSTRDAYRVGDSDVIALARSHSASYQVWGEELGYPGDFDYRDFHRKAGTSRLHYWRVTGKHVGDEQKDYYHPDWAGYKIDQHAEHFSHMVGDLLRNFHTKHSRQGIVMSSFPMELFGWRWYEGVAWLERTLRDLAAHPDFRVTSASEAVALIPPALSLDLYESSWGAGGRHFNWRNPDNAWMWDEIARCTARMEPLATRFSGTSDPDLALTLAQAARELLLLQSGDWQLLIATGEARMYAMSRFAQHVERFDYFAAALEAGRAVADAAAEFYARDHVFPDIDPRLFYASR